MTETKLQNEITATRILDSSDKELIDTMLSLIGRVSSRHIPYDSLGEQLQDFKGEAKIIIANIRDMYA